MGRQMFCKCKLSKEYCVSNDINNQAINIIFKPHFSNANSILQKCAKSDEVCNGAVTIRK